MFLRAKIFRHLLLFALIPSLVVTGLYFYLQSRLLDQAEQHLASFSPDRTINSLRLAEARLQESVLALMTGADPNRPEATAAGLDWLIVRDTLGRTTVLKAPPGTPFPVDSLIIARETSAPLLRHLSGRTLFLGARIASAGRTWIGGFVFDREYLEGFETAATSLSEGRLYRNLRPAFTLFVAVSGGLAVLLVILLAWFLSRRLSASITTPLEELATQATLVARGEHPAAIVPIGTEEMHRVTEVFNQMVVDLDRNRIRLAAAERVTAWQEFARRLAHELKNPLTPLSLSLYRIRKKLQERGDYERFGDSIEAIGAEVEHLKRLADDYASLARLPEPKFGRFDIVRLGREVVELFAPQLEEFHCETNFASAPIEIMGDIDRLREVMVNLIKNALAFTPPQGRITVTVGREQDTVAFVVANQSAAGPASEADLQRAKMPYVTTRPGGMGLGLAISEKIIVDHGGMLTLRPNNMMVEAAFVIPVQSHIAGS